MKQNNFLQIAIDGPVGAGKSIIANLLSKKLGIVYVYTGAMYRAVAYLGLRNNLSLENNEEKIFTLLQKAEIELTPTDQKDRVCNVLIDGEDVSDELFTPEVSWGSSVVATYPKIRQELVKRQQKIAQGQSVIMEGRDIALRVLPEAQIKIFMTADVKVRAQRRWRDLQKKGYQKTYEEVLNETIDRDYQDSHRETDPLKKVAEAWVLDTTNLTIEEVVDLICQKIKEKGLIK
ncbi:(d)CMP kinase [Candidatus Beckwithbacteria bacterium]|nr:(d)CMP kinase [Candidatus Beckwithbacteria bacterium]